MVIIGKRRDSAALAQTYQNAISTARQKVDEADAALLYANEDSARTLIAEARQQIQVIPEKQRQKKYQADVTDLDTKLAVINEKIKHVIAITDPAVLANLSDTATGISPVGIVGLLNGKIVTAAMNQKTLYTTDVASKETATVALPDSLASDPVATTATTAQQGLILFQDNTLLQFDAASNAITPLTIEFPNPDKTLVGAAYYPVKSSLYLLDTKNNTILRHTRSGTKFSKGVNRLDSSANVQNGNDIAIADGDIYLLRSDGSMTNFSDPQFALTATDPVLNAPTKLYGDDGSDHLLYVLDPANKRLVAYSKAGKFKYQYTSDKFDALIDFTIDPGAKKAYLLNGPVVYQIELQ
jgi:hypothetical protein